MDRGTLQQLLADAIATGEVIRIVYRGGSRPGAVREVRPITVTPEWIRARDIAAGVDKTFLLDKIDLTEAPVTALDGPQTVQGAIAPRSAELQALGWEVSLTTDQATLHASVKDGNRRKRFHVSLWFEEYTGIFVVDVGADGNPEEQEEKWKSRAPYHVSSTTLPTRSFANLWKAAALFLEEARKGPTGPAPMKGGAR